MTVLSYVNVDESDKKANHVYKNVRLEDIPKMSDLTKEVKKILDQCSWWDFYGVDWMVMCFATFFTFVALVLMSSTHPLILALGVFLHGCCYQTFAVKGSHSAVHGTVCKSQMWSRFWTRVFSDIMAATSGDIGYEGHIKLHHPHTNIIGLGDSSIWKVPFLRAYLYMYVAPVFLPLVTIPISLYELWGKWKNVCLFLMYAAIGFALNIYLLTSISGFTIVGSLLVLWISRAVLSIPYIHVNIFQHIGLPMYAKKDRPKRIFQMTSGVLNLPRNPFLDFTFGHSIISCHIEHHLFPQLSDNMCLKIQPTVSKFIKESVLPYNEDSYLSRMKYFTDKYEELMVHAPPITHFVGIQ